MEGLESFYSYRKDYQHQAGVLSEAAISLNQLFEVEAERLTREDGVQRLREIQAEVAKELEVAISRESGASYADTKANLSFSIASSIAKLIVPAITENQQARNFVNGFFDTSTEKKRPFGTVMVCVGPKGLPEGVRVVSISELARQSNRPEPEIIQKLQQGGCLLFSQETFSRLIDKLVMDVREGRLRLPVPTEKLSERVASGYQRLEAGTAVYVRLPQPQ